MRPRRRFARHWRPPPSARFSRFWVSPEAPRFKLPPPARGAFFFTSAIHLSLLRFIDPAQFVQHERVFHRDLSIALKSPGFSAVARFHLHMQEQALLTVLQRAKLRHPFDRLVILNLAVPKTGRDEHGRI